MTTLRGRIAGLITAVAMAAGLAVPAAAQDLSSDLNQQFADITQQVEDAAWESRSNRNQLLDEHLGYSQAGEMKTALDTVYDMIFPGMIAEKKAEAERIERERVEAERRAAEAARKEAERLRQARLAEERRNSGFDYGSCPPEAHACVDIDGRRTWLQRNGKVYHGAVFHGPGKPGQETPKGRHYVNRKVRHEVSYIYNMAPMPYAVYFTYNGHAFHQGDPNVLSAGCVRLYQQDAAKYFQELQIGDLVYIY